MDPRSLQSLGAAGWEIAWRQHWAISRAQLLALGLGAEAIRHRLADGRLHRWRWRGVYAVGRPDLSRHGGWMAALLACGPASVLSHESAAALWGVIPYAPGLIHVSLPVQSVRRRPGIRAHRRSRVLAEHVISRERIPVTDIACTLVDLSARVHHRRLEAAVNEADKLDLIDPEALRESLESFGPQPGVRALRGLLDRRTFRLTDSELERRVLRIALRVGLGLPETGVMVNGFKVDFYWPDAEAGRRDGRPALSPDPGATTARSRARPGSPRGRADAAPVHSRAGPLRGGPRRADTAERRWSIEDFVG